LTSRMAELEAENKALRERIAAQVGAVQTG